MKVTPAKRKIRLNINRSVRAMNLDIAKDPLWKGRFVAHIRTMRIEEYEDKSGYTGVAEIEFIDRKTGNTIVKYFDYLEITGLHWDSQATVGWKLFNAMNDFIIEDCKVWEENPRPARDNTIDYTKISYKFEKKPA